MNETPSGESGDVDEAARRLAAALDALEVAVERRRDADLSEEQLAARIQDLGNDRSKLAHELDQAETRMVQLEGTNREIARRLDAAIGTIRSVLDQKALDQGEA